ncbi:MAG: hypothetical protein AABZ53_03670 [Planctomycetota bacterium]
MDGTPQRPGRMTSLLPLAAIAVGGLLCVIAPTLVAGTKLMDAPLFPLIRTSVEGLSWVAIVLLCLLGLASGMLTRLSPFAIAPASVAVLPVAAITEMVVDTSTHNLIPFELVMYLFMTIPALCGAMLGRFLSLRIHRPPGARELPHT